MCDGNPGQAAGEWVELRLLGPIEVWFDGKLLAVGPPKQRCVLAVLALEVNRVVPVETIIDRVWDDSPPAAARSLVQTYVARLRRVLAGSGVTLAYRSGGYVLGMELALVDLHRFRSVFARSAAMVPGDVECALAGMRGALGLWRGSPLSDLDGDWARRMRGALREQQLAARRQLLDAHLAAGWDQQALAQIDELLAAHPLDEKLIGQRMLALHRIGRQAEALTCYREARARLLNEVGDEPGPELRNLHQRLLGRDPALGAAAKPPMRKITATRVARRPNAPRTDVDEIARQTLDRALAEVGISRADRVEKEYANGMLMPFWTWPPDLPREAESPVPRQLPAPLRLFTGRSAELARLSKALDAQDDNGAAVVISAIGGIGGMGKTWLALSWAHQNRARFPDGQLYVNLRGFDPAGQPLPPAVVIRGFLDALGARPDAIPVDFDAQVGLYRSLIAGRRMLVLLDNARDSAQVAPLLPGDGSCAVLVTSRHRLTSLASGHGAQQLDLDVLPETEAAGLLARHLGHDRTAAEPDAVAEILGCCAGLPLALGIVSARASAQPELPLAALADELRHAADRLDTLDGGELGFNFRAVLSRSYRALSTEAARVFGLLGLAPGADISLSAAASLTGLPHSRARVVLRDLDSAYLVQQYSRDRYRMHDLVRLYAAERAGYDQPPGDRTSALQRLLDFYGTPPDARSS